MQRISHGKSGPNSRDFEFLFYIFFKLPDFYDKFQYVAEEYRTILFFFFLFFFLLSYRVCSQIWLNYFMNDQHFGYITKSLKGNLAPTVKAQW
jgi:hypothetical protein